MGAEDRGGEAYFGEPELMAYWRSSAKPFQVLPLVKGGGAERFGVSREDLAVCCASHAASPEHVRRVRELLGRMGLDEEDLACGPHRPFDDTAARELEREGREYGRVHNNCSGKHASLLAQALHAGDPPEGYQELGHPVQRRFREELDLWLDVDPERLSWGVDGCGLPTPYLSLRQMARAFGRLARAAAEGERAPRRVVDAMTSHPRLVSGEGRLTARLMEAGGGGLLAKEGAEGVLCMAGVDDGWGLALKVRDGASRAMGAAAAEAIVRLELLGAAERQALEELRAPAVRNTRDEEVGRIEASLEVRHGHVAGRV